jgi:hypothetical protein
MIKRIEQQEESPTQINVTINWFDELRRSDAALAHLFEMTTPYRLKR